MAYCGLDLSWLIQITYNFKIFIKFSRGQVLIFTLWKDWCIIMQIFCLAKLFLLVNHFIYYIYVFPLRHLIIQNHSKCSFFIISVNCLLYNTTLIWKLTLHPKPCQKVSSNNTSHIYRGSCSQMIFKKGVLEQFCNIHRKIIVLESLFNKVSGLKAFNFIKKILQHRCFPVNITKFLKALFSKDHLWWLLLHLLEYYTQCFLNIMSNG